MLTSPRDNWERLVVAVVKRQQIWELCHQDSRSPSICSTVTSDDLSEQSLSFSGSNFEPFSVPPSPLLPPKNSSISQGKTTTVGNNGSSGSITRMLFFGRKSNDWMGYDVAKLTAQSSSAAYSPLKDMILYFKNNGKYVRELEDNLTKLTAEMGTFYSKKQQIDRVLERGVSKAENDEYQSLVKQFELFLKKYNKFILKYSKHCQNLPSVPPGVEASTDVLTISSVIEALQTRKPTILTYKFFKLATLSKDISKLHGHILRVTNRMEAENVMLEKKVESVQVKHDDVDLPSFTEYVQEILSCLAEDENRSIGILGPIGVGKTSVMKMLNNQLKNFEVVIWINYSKQLDAEEKTIEMMQDVIMGRLKLNKEKENNTEQNADMISTALKHKKYILLIDQVSSAFDFDRVGIHKDHKFGKVVLASSSNKVIRRMTDTHVEVGPLSQEDSLDLFRVFDDDIPEIQTDEKFEITKEDEAKIPEISHERSTPPYESDEEIREEDQENLAMEIPRRPEKMPIYVGDPADGESELDMSVQISAELKFEILSSSSLRENLDLDSERDNYWFSTIKKDIKPFLIVNRSGGSSNEMPTDDEWRQAGAVNLSGNDEPAEDYNQPSLLSKFDPESPPNNE